MEGTYIPRWMPDKKYKLTLEELSNLHYGDIVLLAGPKTYPKDDEIFEWCREQDIHASWAGRYYVEHTEYKEVWIVHGEAKRVLFSLRWA